MALTVTIQQRGIIGTKRYVQGRFLADASWVVAGESLTASDLSMDHIDMLKVQSQGGIEFHWSRSADTILAYRTGSGENAVLTAVATAQNIAAIATAVEFFAIGY